MDLHRLVEEGKFRPDLYYRVARAILHIPPLRERREDVVLYLHYFLETINKAFKVSIRGFSKEAMDILVAYDWPGNVRQLINVLEQIAIDAWDVEEITVEHLPREICLSERPLYERNTGSTHLDKTQQLRNKEKDSITSALRQTRGNKRRAAMLLEMPRSTFYHKIKRYGINSSTIRDVHHGV